MELEDWYTLDEVTPEGTDTKLKDFPFKEKLNEAITLFWEPKEQKGNGFNFVALEWCAGPDSDSGLEYYQLFAIGYGYFDGIRHLYWIRDKNPRAVGYDYYPKMDNYLAVCSRLKEIEKEYCRDA